MNNISDFKANKRRRLKISIMAVFAVFCMLLPISAELFVAEESALEADAASHATIDRMSNVSDL